ncbi:MAG: universal stress protein [Myxococcales bacterium]|nr:universal stress protein [Myxococcales bacterium]
MTQSAKIYRIVVGIDYSSTSELALRTAFELAAKEERAEVHAVNVVSAAAEFTYTELPATGAGLSIRQAHEELEAYINKELAAWQEATGKSFSRCVGHVRTEFPAEEIAQLGSDLEADLIVVGTHGRRGVRRLVLGSVAEGVVRMARGPVLVVRPREIKKDVPEIEPPCPRCVETREATGGAELWCEQHRERHGQRHTYRYDARPLQPTDFTLVKRM